MPIRPDLKLLYPENWEEIRVKILDRANDCCENCGEANGAFGIRDKKGKFHHVMDFAHETRILDDETMFDPQQPAIRIVLTIAHLNHDVTKNDGMEEGGPALPVGGANLNALCQQCHNRHDGPHRSKNRSLTRDRNRGQSRMF